MNETRDISTITFVLAAAGFPLLSALVCLAVPKRWIWLAPIVATLCMLAATVAVGFLFARGWQTEAQASVTWFQLGEQSIALTVLADRLSIPMLSMVVLVSLLVHVYSVGFMADDTEVGRYFSFLGFFTFAMMGLVISGNLFVLFCFWELVGFSSYLLIGHWRDRVKAGRAATKAFIVNRIGDVMFIVGLMIVWKNLGSFELSALMSTTSNDTSWLTWVGICFFGGVIGKSAQFPLLTWLPDAMEGPTPVSALIHAATMVAAGVYLLLRIPFVITAPTATVIALVGGVTTLYGGWLALRQYDLKKILAYSTISQLGFMMVAIGAGSEVGAFTHLIAHALFKACLFLSAGAVIHSLYHAAKVQHFDPQDIRNMGGWWWVAPRLTVATGLALAALCGLPLLSGFISKEMIFVPAVHRAMLGQGWLPWLYVVILFASSALTVLYSYRLFATVFLGTTGKVHLDVKPIPPIMQWPISVLAILSLWFFFSWNPTGPGGWLSNMGGVTSAYAHQWHTVFSQATAVMWSSLAWTFAFLALGWWLFTRSELDLAPPRHTLDDLYGKTVVSPVLRASNAIATVDVRRIDALLHLVVYSQVTFAKAAGLVDRYVVDGAVVGMAWAARWIGTIIRRTPGSNVQGYLVWTAIALIIFIFWLLK